MKNQFHFIIVFVLLGIFACNTVPKGSKTPSLLVFSKTAGFRHQSIEIGKETFLKLASLNNFNVDTTEDASLFTVENLKKYDAVVFLNTTQDVLNDTQQKAFEGFIQEGKGFIGIHSAADTEYEWPWYGKLVGAYFNGHPNNPNVREADLDLIEKNHPSTKMLPDRWHRNDEWYNYKNINPAVNVLLNLDETSYEGGTNGKNHPIAWYHEYDGGRAWFTGGGHTKASFMEPLFLSHLLGGIQYALGSKGASINTSNIPKFDEATATTNTENSYTTKVLNGDIPSPRKEMTATIKGKKILMNYGSPSAKGRALWDNLVPYEKVWRTGANEATSFKTEDDIMIEGQKLPAGVYGFFTKPSASSWEIIFNSQAKQWGAYNYDASKDVLKITVSPRTIENFSETMEFKVYGDAILLHWGNLVVPFKVAAN